MPYRIIRGDISNLDEYVDAIVSPAHPNHEKRGQGTEQAIHAKAGPALMAARTAKGAIVPGEAVVTTAFSLNAKLVIHTLIPYWNGGNHNERDLLRRCYDRSLEIARNHDCRSIAFPLLGTGNLGFPRNLGILTAIHSFLDFCSTNDMDILLVLFDQESFEECLKYQPYIEEKISSGDVQTLSYQEYTRNNVYISPEERHQIILASRALLTAREDAINNIFTQTKEESIAPTLVALMEWMTAQTGLSASNICEEKGYLQRQHYSNNIYKKSNAKPQKRTVLSYAVAFELNIKQTTELLQRAGYVFPGNNEFDQIVAKWISNSVYDIQAINTELEKNGQKILGCR